MTKERGAVGAAGSGYDAPRTAVVLGASGFVGRNICAAAHAAGWSVTGFARRPRDPVPPWPVLALDVARAATGVLVEALARPRPTLVVNAAGALWDVTDDELTEGNVTLVERLVNAVSTLPGPVRLVHVGSAYEYGSHPGRTSLAETLPGRPASRYAQTKLAGTRILTRAVEDGRIDAVTLRIALSVGPFAPRHSVLGGLAHQLAARPEQVRLPPVFGVRDIVDVRDVAEAVLAAATAPTVPPVVNIGAGVCVGLTDAVDALIRIAGSTASVVRVPPPAMRRDAGVGDVPLDIGLARRRLGWAPARTLEAALRALWDSVAGDAVRR